MTSRPETCMLDISSIVDRKKERDKQMPATRREFLKQTAAGTLATAAIAVNPGLTRADAEKRPSMIVDTHQHLWDPNGLHPPWLARAPEVLRRSYGTREYLQATRGWNVKAIYMEVAMDPSRHRAEAERVVGLCRGAEHPTVAAVVGGRPASPDFAEYVKWLKTYPEIKGVRQILHATSAAAGFCLTEEFIRGIRLLGQNGLRFDLCMRPAELADGVKLARLCPDTRLIVDHCGNADPRAFATQADDDDRPPSHEADPWRRDMEALAKRPNVSCKISGIVARAPEGWRAEHLAPIVDHCLDTFGPDRVVFGGDWPVCLKGAPLSDWIVALTEIIAERPADQQTKLWRGNAERVYGLCGA